MENSIFLKGSRIGSMNLSYRTKGSSTPEGRRPKDSESALLMLVHSSSTLAVAGAIIYVGVLQGVVMFTVYLTIGVLLTQCLIHILFVCM
jgi:hypothetical protein